MEWIPDSEYETVLKKQEEEKLAIQAQIEKLQAKLKKLQKKQNAKYLALQIQECYFYTHF